MAFLHAGGAISTAFEAVRHGFVLLGCFSKGTGVSRPGFLRRHLVISLRKVAVWSDGADGPALPTEPLNSATRLAKVRVEKMEASGPCSTMARASA
jgi:hypothetical protein